MKKTFIALSALALTTLAVSCSVKDKILDAVFTAFTANVANYDATIPAITNVTSYQSLSDETVQFDLDSAVKAQTGDQFSIDNINTVTMEAITLTLDGTGTEAPDANNNFANFEMVKVTFHSDANNTPVTFELTNNPDTYATTLTIPVDNTVNLKSYLTGKIFTYNVSAKARRGTTHPLHVNVAVKMKIDK